MSHAATLAASGASLEHLRDLVESAIESNDVGPLVKAVFEVDAAEAGGERGSGGGEGMGGVGPAVPLPPGRGDGGESALSGTTRDSDGGGGGAEEGSVLERVLELLGEVAEEKEAEIAQICRSNAAEIAGAMHEMGTMQRDTAALRKHLLASNSTLQAAGTSFAGRLEEVQEASALQQGVAEARQAVGSALQVLQLCVKAAKLIEGKQLYKAYKTLEAVQRDHGAVLRGGYDLHPQQLPGNVAPGTPLPRTGAVGAAVNGSREGTPMKAGTPAASAAAAAGGVTVPAPGGRLRPGSGGNSGGVVQLGPLALFLRERVAELAAALEQRAIADFNNWLASVRAQARTIGMRAIRWAASERQQEEQLARQRKLLLPQLEQLADVRAAGELVATTLRAPGVQGGPPPTPLDLPAAVGTPPSVAAGAAGAAGLASPRGAASSSTSSSSTAARMATFRSARQAASSPTRAAAAGAAGSAAAAAAGSAVSPPGSGVSTTRGAASTAAGETTAAQTPQGHGPARCETTAATGDLLDGVDMTPLHRCVHIHACLGRLPQFIEYYAQNRRQQLATDLALAGDFLSHYQGFLTQLVGYFLVEDAVSRTAGVGTAEGPLDLVAQVDAAWDTAVAALKRVLEPAFRGATAAAAMLTVKDFLLLVCLALDHCGYHTVSIKEVLMGGRGKYQELLGAAAVTAVQAAVSNDSLAAPVEVESAARAQELFGQLALPPTFRSQDAGNKRPPFKAPFTPMVPQLVRIIRDHIVDTVAYLKGLLTAGEVVPAARKYRDRMLSRVVVEALQRRVDSAAGEVHLPVEAALQLVANVGALLHSLGPLDDFALAQARGDTSETVAAVAAAAAAAAASRSPSPGRGRSRSPGRGEIETEEGQRGRQPAGGSGAAAAGGGGAGGEGPGGGSGSVRQQAGSPTSSHGSAPSPGGSPQRLPAAAALAAAAAIRAAAGDPTLQQSTALPQPASSQQSGHTVLSVSATTMTSAAAAVATASSRGPGGASASGVAAELAGSSAAAFASLLGSAESLAVQAMAAQAAEVLAQAEQLDWAPAEQQRSTAYSGYVDELILYLKECASLVNRMAPDASAARMLRGIVRYVGEATMLQLMSDAVTYFNIFGLQRLYSDLGGISRAAGSMGVPGLSEELAEPLLFCEMMVFASLEELLQPELRLGKYLSLDLRRAVFVLDKYQELDKTSQFAGMHKSKQAERFISRKTVDKVLRELREQSRSASPAASRGNSFTASEAGRRTGSTTSRQG